MQTEIRQPKERALWNKQAESYDNQTLEIQAKKLMKQFGILPFTKFYTKADLQNSLSKSSFKVIESDILHPAPVNYYLLASKPDK